MQVVNTFAKQFYYQSFYYFEDNCHDTKLLTSYRSLLKMKHEEYRKKAAKGIITLHNFENIEEDFFFKLVFFYMHI